MCCNRLDAIIPFSCFLISGGRKDSRKSTAIFADSEGQGPGREDRRRWKRKDKNRCAMIGSRQVSPEALQRETMARMSRSAQCRRKGWKGDEERWRVSRKRLVARWERRSAHPRSVVAFCKMARIKQRKPGKNTEPKRSQYQMLPRPRRVRPTEAGLRT
jgi:hypothetical protein